MDNAAECRPGTDGGTIGLNRRRFVFALGAVLAYLIGCAPSEAPETLPETRADTVAPQGDLLAVIERRRSLREYSDEPVSAEDVAVMLRAAQGVTDEIRGFRAAPSAGALYPLETYLVTAEGTRRYVPAEDTLDQIDDADLRKRLATAAYQQGFIADAPVVFVITGTYSRTATKYGERAPRYVHLEAGHAAQNLLLAAEHLGLGGVPVGAFDDDEVRGIIGAAPEETPLYVIPVGRRP